MITRPQSSDMKWYHFATSFEFDSIFPYSQQIGVLVSSMVKCDSEITASLTHLANGLLEHDAGEELSANPRTKIPSDSFAARFSQHSCTVKCHIANTHRLSVRCSPPSNVQVNVWKCLTLGQTDEDFFRCMVSILINVKFTYFEISPSDSGKI